MQPVFGLLNVCDRYLTKNNSVHLRLCSLLSENLGLRLSCRSRFLWHFACFLYVDCSCKKGLAWQAMRRFPILRELQPVIVVNASRSVRASNVPARPEWGGKIRAIIKKKWAIKMPLHVLLESFPGSRHQENQVGRVEMKLISKKEKKKRHWSKKAKLSQKSQSFQNVSASSKRAK